MFLLPYCWHFKSSRKQIHDTKFWFQSTSKNITFYTVQTSTTVWIDEYSQLQCMVWTKFWLLYHLNQCEGETEEGAEEAIMAEGADGAEGVEVLEGTDGTTLEWYVFFSFPTISIQYLGFFLVMIRYRYDILASEMTFFFLGIYCSTIFFLGIYC